MKIAIVYSSVTGNTKMVAEAVYKEVTQHHDCDVVYFGTVSDSIPKADFYILGSWTDNGNVAAGMGSFLESLKIRILHISVRLGIKAMVSITIVFGVVFSHILILLILFWGIFTVKGKCLWQ